MKRSAPTATLTGLDDAGRAHAGDEAKSCAGRQLESSLLRGRRRWRAATGCSDCASTLATRRRASSLVDRGAGCRSVSSGLPTVSVPVLSKAISVTSRSVCSASPLRNSTPSSARAPGSGHDGGGRGEAHGAGAGDDQHRHRVDQRIGQARLRADQHPDGERQRRDAKHDGHEDRR